MKLYVSVKDALSGIIFWNNFLKGNRIIKLIIKISTTKATALYQTVAGPVNVFSFGRLSFFIELCDLIDMERCEVHFWDDVGVSPEEQQTQPHTKGTSAVCFILTSTIVVHTLDLLKSVYVNIFSCKEFDPKAAGAFTKKWFGAQDCSSRFIDRN